MKSSDKKEIAFVVTSMGRGGAERVVSILANYYASIDWKVHIIMLWHNIVEYKLNEAITVHDLSSSGKNPYLRLPAVMKRLRKVLKEIAPKSVVSFIAQNNIVAYFSCKRLNVRFIPSERIDPASMKRGWLYTKMLNRVYARSTATVLQTERALKFFSVKVQKNSRVIYNPVTVSCQAAKEREKTIITAGRLEKQKNHQMLISAFARFHEQYPDYKLAIYGEGVLRSQLETLINDLGLGESIFLPGAVSDIQEKMSKAEIFALSSNFEGMSNALMEAMAIGVPCISTNCAGSDELIQNEENGLLIDVGDEEGMLNALLYMAEHREVAAEMGKKAREFSAVYATENVIEQWRKVIEGE